MKGIPLCAVALGLAMTAPPLWTQKQTTAEPPDIDPEAIAALNRMGTYLRTLKAFQVHANVDFEDVLVDGQKWQFASMVDLLVQAPDRLRAAVNSDRRERVFFFDGKNFTLFGPRVNYYATVPAPATIAELANRLEEKYDIELPFVDLFRWGGPHSNLAEIKSATDVGPSQVGDTTCEQYAFRQSGLDWQIWIQKGDFPLPRKLVLTTLTDEARPQHSSVYTWNLAPSFNEESFKFVAPVNAQRIVFSEWTPSGAEREK